MKPLFRSAGITTVATLLFAGAASNHVWQVLTNPINSFAGTGNGLFGGGAGGGPDCPIPLVEEPDVGPGGFVTPLTHSEPLEVGSVSFRVFCFPPAP